MSKLGEYTAQQRGFLLFLDITRKFVQKYRKNQEKSKIRMTNSN